MSYLLHFYKKPTSFGRPFIFLIYPSEILNKDLIAVR